ncbi:amidase [Govanella unica]|uniref:Amidase family protein n=1 Tax=Govanella unica TaxID=2975056 RepID=A0A9X3U025_9PROT|nr:amidase family protein [Govania unica]MDA5194832.1 amidase family protein [Govania unica]
MKISEYVRYDGLGLADLMQKGEVSPAETAAAALEAVARVNPEVHAVIETYPERAQPRSLDDFPAGPFRGVPFMVKDLVIHETGKKIEGGSRLAAGMVAPHDTDLMVRYRAAGLNVLGRTKSPEMGYNLSTENLLHGPVHNPWNTERSAGGSSGGSAAAVAAGILPLAHANDGGGSIRIPASVCGLVGLRPTRGRTPLGPDTGTALNGFGVEHVVSRTVRDSAAALDATEGPGIGDPFEIARPARSYLEAVSRAPRPLRVGFMVNAWGGWRTAPDIAAALEDTARLLGDLGHHVEDASPNLGMSWDSFIETNAVIWSANIATWIDGIAGLTGRAIGPDTLEATTLAAYEFGSSLTAKQYLGADAACNQVCRSVAPFFEQYDVLLTPTLPQPPQAIGFHNADEQGVDAREWPRRVFQTSPFTPLFNMTGQPAMSLPLHQGGDGLPIGMQIVARYGREEILFSLAGQLEQACPWTGRVPPVFASH